MPIFSFKAIDNDGKVKRGKLSAENDRELESKLRQSGLELLNCKEVSKFGILNAFNKSSDKELALICIHLHYLELAGVPILESIGDLRDTAENPKIREVMMDLYDSLKNGKLFSEALASHPQMFDNVFIGLIKAGERSGDFAEIFMHLETHYKWIAEIKKRIVKATAYPIFLIIIMFVVTGIMMVFVIPKLATFLETQNIPLPGYSKALIATSNFFVAWWWAILIAPFVIYGAIKIAAYSSEQFAIFIDRIKLKVPIVGPVLKKIEIARFCHFFSILYKSGLGIIECLDVAKSVMTNKVLRKAIEEIKNNISEGVKLTDAVIASKEFPTLVTRMFKVGEDSGKLDQSLKNVNLFYEGEINTAIDAMVGSLQPILTMVMGSLLMWITASVFGPIYGNFGNFGKG